MSCGWNHTLWSLFRSAFAQRHKATCDQPSSASGSMPGCREVCGGLLEASGTCAQRAFMRHLCSSSEVLTQELTVPSGLFVLKPLTLRIHGWRRRSPRPFMFRLLLKMGVSSVPFLTRHRLGHSAWKALRWILELPRWGGPSVRFLGNCRQQFCQAFCPHKRKVPFAARPQRVLYCPSGSHQH